MKYILLIALILTPLAFIGMSKQSKGMDVAETIKTEKPDMIADE